ncbi:hypothetical protein [Burkholderia cepacia]|uniref:hypothetical protein n=1 Tax=Burkholderia cepacia TaxID=292 RepID=UPI001CF56C68|nr:hypothetical protein [Burkholderia cepacia]MCA8109967.1 hypothetical protein [Burkholderia cepacia]MCA8396265.1 hypothetical protein [Burkholderia cepacia]
MEPDAVVQITRDDRQAVAGFFAFRAISRSSSRCDDALADLEIVAQATFMFITRA